jgi:hypothetical protein
MSISRPLSQACVSLHVYFCVRVSFHVHDVIVVHVHFVKFMYMMLVHVSCSCLFYLFERKIWEIGILLNGTEWGLGSGGQPQATPSPIEDPRRREQEPQNESQRTPPPHHVVTMTPRSLLGGGENTVGSSSSRSSGIEQVVICPWTSVERLSLMET